MKFDINEFIAGIRENKEVSNERLYDQEIEETFEDIISIKEHIARLEQDINEMSQMLEEEVQRKYESLVIYRDEVLNKTKGE